MLKNLCCSLAIGAGLLGAVLLQPHGVAQAQAVSTSPATASSDPSSQQIYAATRAGDLGQAEQMVERVLRDHPTSAKAHYVAAQVYARSGNVSRARSELAQAQSLNPGLAFASPRAVQELQQQLSGRRILYGSPVVHRSGGISWGIVLLIGAIGAVIFALFRRRTTSYPQGQPGAYPAANPYGPYPGSGPVAGGPYGPYGPGAGAGSGLMGGLATGLAVGAGVAAGEQLMHHVLGGGSNAGLAPGSVLPEAQAGELQQVPNADLGGNDFGMTDGGSWDDGGAGGDLGGDDFGGGGGGDWT